MIRSLEILVAGLVACALAAGAAAPLPAQAAPGDPKLAVIFPGPVQDADFNAVGYVGVQGMRRRGASSWS